MSSIVATLFENDYHLGVGALVNSLVESGFQGKVIAGYRGSLPSWVYFLPPITTNVYRISSEVVIEFIVVESQNHFALQKPLFCMQVLDREKEANTLFYFDPDIVLVAPWNVFVSWVKLGVAFCEDLESPLNNRHPKRLAWLEFFRHQEWNFKNQMDIYANSGFVGVNRVHASFFALWQRALSEIEQILDKSQIRLSDRFHPFYIPDQETFNIALMAFQGPLAPVGKEGMGLVPGANLMAHAIIRGPKPWQKNYLKEMLQGSSPHFADKSFIRFISKPIAIEPLISVFSRPLALRLASFISRFYSRNL